ncbi:hypothetical protein ACROSR_06565 [Roseovarius tibetensis]|uniref:hypothetical protein n=1 Tax=Roseovarius tibetensis TaxID=2685897 RepID=UPI003D7FA79A
MASIACHITFFAMIADFPGSGNSFVTVREKNTGGLAIRLGDTEVLLLSFFRAATWHFPRPWEDAPYLEGMIKPRGIHGYPPFRKPATPGESP